MISRGGIRCIACGKKGFISVTDTRVIRHDKPALDVTQRRKRCAECGKTWATFEVHQDTYRMIRKAFAHVEKAPKRWKGGSPTSREELLKSIRKIEGRSQ